MDKVVKRKAPEFPGHFPMTRKPKLKASESAPSQVLKSPMTARLTQTPAMKQSQTASRINVDLVSANRMKSPVPVVKTINLGFVKKRESSLK